MLLAACSERRKRGCCISTTHLLYVNCDSKVHYILKASYFAKKKMFIVLCALVWLV